MCQEIYPNTFSINVKVGAYFLLGSRASEIFGSALPAFTLEGNARVFKNLNIWLGASYLFGNGTAIGSHDKTHLNFVPISLGLKYVYPISPFVDAYLGAGPCYSFLNTRDHSSFVHKKVSKENWGAIVKSGLIYKYNNNLFFEGFINYTYQKFNFRNTSNDPFVYRNDLDLSGIELGVSVGWGF
jgi:outer membrane protein W